jgi:ssDNA-binding Zn-finger/Zn-ribbon topoisomerase 1
MQGKRKFVGVVFQCCKVYARIYANAKSTAYVGACPRCGKRLVLRIGPEGTDSRFFTAQ